MSSCRIKSSCIHTSPPRGNKISIGIRDSTTSACKFKTQFTSNGILGVYIELGMIV
jgi:hypothetical protein